MKKCMMMVMSAIVLLVNPMVFMSGCDMYGCGEPVRYDYSAADMMRELQAIPTMQRVQLEDGRSVEVSFTLDMQSARDVARVQMRRDFVLELVERAHACDIDISKSIDVNGEVIVREVSADGEVSVVFEDPDVAGRYTVNSTRLDSGRLVWGNGADYFYVEDAIAVIHTRTGAGKDAELIRVYLGEGNDLNYEHPDMNLYY